MVKRDRMITARAIEKSNNKKCYAPTGNNNTVAGLHYTPYVCREKRDKDEGGKEGGGAKAYPSPTNEGLPWNGRAGGTPLLRGAR